MKAIIKSVIDKSIDEKINTFNNNCLRECIEKKYITGIAGDLNLNNDFVGSLNNPKVTESGYEYLAKGPNWLAIISAICAIIGVIIAILSRN